MILKSCAEIIKKACLCCGSNFGWTLGRTCSTAARTSTGRNVPTSLGCKILDGRIGACRGDSAQALADATPLRSAQELVPLSVAKTVGEILGRFCHFTSFLYMDNVVILADFQVITMSLPLITGLNEVCKSASRVLGGDISAGVGGLCTDLNEISRSYQQAQSALDYSAIMGEGRAIYIKDVEPDTSVQLQFGEQEERALINAIKLGGEEEITKVVNELFSRFEAQLIPVGQYQVYLVELVTALLRVVRTYELNTDEVFGEEFNYFTTIFSHSPSKIRQWLIEACTRN